MADATAREVQGWLLPAATGSQPLVVEIHGGPHTLYGWSPMLEWQVLAGSGVSVLAANPRGSEGYGEAFNRGNLGDWGDGPMADVLAGVDQAIEDGLADPERLGVTGGSYGGYLTTWIIGRTQRFKAAITCRSVRRHGDAVPDRRHLGRGVGEVEFGRSPWDDRSTSTRSRRSRSRASPDPAADPAQRARPAHDHRPGEALFTVLRSLQRPVRFMRVPDESHELTRAATPFRRAENLSRSATGSCTTWSGAEEALPAPPRNRAGRVGPARVEARAP